MFKKLNIDAKITIKLAVLGLIAWLYLGRSFDSFKTPYVMGDGFEYILMTEAISNHFTPNVTFEDCERFKKRFKQYHNWDAFFKKDYIDNLIEYFKNSKCEYKETNGGFFGNKNKKWFSYHFSFYSFINVPAYKIGAHFGPIRTFYFTNAILVIITCFVLLFYLPFSLFTSILAALCFCFSSCYWYLSWQHTEVLTACLVAMSIVNLLNKKYYLSIFLTALACLQNQPLILLLAFISLITLIKNGWNKKNILWILGLGFIALLPPLFYYINFSSTNLIKDAGYLDTKYITLNRVLGFYFDINQGMILTIPIILLTYLVLITLEVKDVIRKKINFEYTLLLPLVIIAISVSIATMGNWNHGMAIINRYASWISIIVMIHAFYLINRYSLVVSSVFFSYFFMTQLFTTLYHEKFNDMDWSFSTHTPIATWVLRNYPEWYNPDPYIFAIRSQPNTNLTENNSPFIYFHNKEVKKVMVNETRVDSLVNFGVSKANIEKIKDKISYNYGWGYVDPDLFKGGLSDEKIYNIIRERKVSAAYYKILSSSVWTKQIGDKAILWKMTFDQVLRIDAEYIVNEDEKAANKE